MDIIGQMSGAEWLYNLPGTNEEKRLLVTNCNWCHSYQQVFRSRYDELRLEQSRGKDEPLPGLTTYLPKFQWAYGAGRRGIACEVARPGQGTRLTQIRSFKEMPYPTGPATEVVVREYELPRLYLATHGRGPGSQ